MTRFRNLILVTMLLGLTWACLIEPVAAQKADPTERYAQLRRTAQLEGMVPVIVALDVPQIGTYTRAATRYKGVVSSFSYQVSRYLADAVLSDRIATTAETVESRLASKAHRVRQRYHSLPLMAMEVSEEALAELAATPEVIRISRDREHLPVLNNTVNIIRASNAWNDGYTGEGWFVAILDTGILKTHEMFAGKTIVEACFARGTDGTPDCPDGSGSMTGSGAAAHHPNTYDGWDHGTHVSGIAAGLSSSLSGVARDADVLAIQVFSRRDSGCSGGGSCVTSFDSDIIAGLDHVFSLRTTYQIAAVNLSLGSGRYTSQAACDSDPANQNLKTPIDNLRAAGIATLVSSGNDGNCDGIGSPACISSAIAVGATTDGDSETSFSDWHVGMLDLFAPGQSVNSSLPDTNSSYGSRSGTSMAAPHATGVWALLRQKNADLSVSDLLSAVTNNGVSITTRCTAQSGSKSRVRAKEALDAINTSTPSAPSNLAATAVESGRIDLTWTDNSGNETGFKIERKTGAGGTFSQITTTAENSTSHTDSGLSEGTLYVYRVRATNSSGDSAYSGEANDTTHPDAPTSLTATMVSEAQIDLAWTDNSGLETGFKIERKTGSGGTYTQIATPGANTTAYSDTGLSSGTTYFYRTRAFDGNGDSTYSNEANTTTNSPSGSGSDGGGGGGGGGGCFIMTAAKATERPVRGHGSPLLPASVGVLMVLIAAAVTVGRFRKGSAEKSRWDHAGGKQKILTPPRPGGNGFALSSGRAAISQFEEDNRFT